MTPDNKRKALKCIALAIAALVTVGSFFAVPWIARAIPASFTSLLMLSSPATPVVALRPEPKPHESILWEESEPSAPPEEEESGEEEPPPPPPEDAITVMADSFCWYDPGDVPTLNLINHTAYQVDVPSYAQKAYPIEPLSSAQEPLVLIIHTHGTEAYLPSGTDYYLPDEDFRSEDPAQTVVAVGNAIAESLEELGIPTLHDTTMHDQEDFNRAYTNSARTIKAYLEKYPSIRYVLDVHRDSIFGEGNVCEKTLTVVEDTPTAQVMLVVGTDESGSSHPGWRKNFTVASHLEERLNLLYPTLARPVNLREHGFNQWFSTGSLIVEVGSCGNTVEEAVTAGSFFAAAFADLVKSGG